MNHALTPDSRLRTVPHIIRVLFALPAGATFIDKPVAYA
jgi:hypothetical protein